MHHNALSNIEERANHMATDTAGAARLSRATERGVCNRRQRQQRDQRTGRANRLHILGLEFSGYKLANCWCRNEVFSNVFVASWHMGGNLLTHDSEQAFAIRIKNTRS